jgi:hypothetical protein
MLYGGAVSEIFGGKPTPTTTTTTRMTMQPELEFPLNEEDSYVTTHRGSSQPMIEEGDDLFVVSTTPSLSLFSLSLSLPRHGHACSSVSSCVIVVHTHTHTAQHSVT